MKQVIPIPSLERPLLLTSFFSLERPVWTLADLARSSGLPKASCLRALRALERFTLVQRFEGGYRLGTRLLELGGIVQESYPARRVATPWLERMRDETLQSTQWVVRDGAEGIYLDVYEPRARIRMYIAPGRRAPLYAGASTRLLLAFAPEEVRNDVLAAPLRIYTSITPRSVTAVRALLEASRRTWLAASFGELEPHSAEVAAPVMGSDGEMVAAVSLAGTAAVFRAPPELTTYVNAVAVAAERISRELGFRGPWKADPKSFLRDVLAAIPDG